MITGLLDRILGAVSPRGNAAAQCNDSWTECYDHWNGGTYVETCRRTCHQSGNCQSVSCTGYVCRCDAAGSRCHG